ncbi:MAG: hypothetical protein A3K19_01980 [Lentisphaerae bacterium RIFOXYB12_FULL_65_16]|nr:MAG: hypothetical protein A3K19_01980 [Lentisphaerae bacterium RIFOXYB12_FULL_65_16]
MAFAHLLDNVEQVVLPYELLAGSIQGLWPLANGLPSSEARLEEARQVVAQHVARLRQGSSAPAARTARWALHARDHFDANIPYDDLQAIARTVADAYTNEPQLDFAEVYRVLEDHFQFDYGADTRRDFAELPWFAANHLHLNYAKPLRLGLSGIRREVEAKLAGHPAGETAEFYQAALITVEAAIQFVRRYGETLRGEAASCADEYRQAELADMATVVDAVAELPPQTFREAIQLVWLVHVMANTGGGTALSFARFDQYMFPFYDADIRAGRLTREAATELVACMWLKVNEPKMRTVQSICLAGTTTAGNDGTNDLSLLCLDVAAMVREPYPNTCVRVRRDSPEALWERILNLMRIGAGQPMLFNDDVMIPGLTAHAGHALPHARDYYPMGCVEIMIQGKCATWRGVGAVTFPAILDDMFRNGSSPSGGDTAGPCRGELASASTFEEFFDAYLARLREHVMGILGHAEETFEATARQRTDPFASALVDGCLEHGMDVEQGGAECPVILSVGSRGIGTAVDALAAVKTFVFDRGDLTLSDMKDLLVNNFAGSEAWRTRLAMHRAAFGNDQDDVDRIAVRIYNAYADTVTSFRSVHKCVCVPNMFSYTDHVRFGELIGATPDGRRRGAPISDALGPSQGRDVSGPTALINSASKFDFRKMTGGCAFNIKLDTNLFGDRAGRRRLESLVRTYLARGGLQIQVNFVDPAALEDARKNPAQHRDLIVRVAGFCEYFHKLDRGLQDEIINRTVQR